MQDAPSPSGNASQPDVFQGSQPGNGQSVGTSIVTCTSASAGTPANLNTNLITGLADPNLSCSAAAVQRGALVHPVQPGQQPGQFYFPSLSADLRPASAPGFAYSSLLSATAPSAPAQAMALSIAVPSSLAGGAAAAQEPLAVQAKKRKPNMSIKLCRVIADVRSTHNAAALL